MSVEAGKYKYELSDQDKRILGKRDNPPKPKKLQIAIPLHYGVKGVMWASRFVTEAELEGYVHQFPNMQILDEKYKIKREEGEDDSSTKQG